MRDHGEGALTAGFALTAEGARWAYAGPLTFANAAEVFAAASRLPLPAAGVVELDGLQAVDSVAVAVLLALKRRALSESKPLRFAGVPPLLHALATVYDVDPMLADDASR